MFNINNKNLISFGLGILFITIFTSVLIPENVSANSCIDPNMTNTSIPYYYYCGNTNSNNNGNNNGNNNDITINPISTIISINPASARINSNTTITVNGYDFVQGSVVKWNSEDRPTTYINSSTIKAQLNYSDLSTSGDYLVTVSNPIPGGGLSNAVLFKVNNNIVSSTSNNNVSNTTSSGNEKTTNTTSNNTSSSTTNEQTTNGSQVSDLAAGAIFGSNGFLPSSIFQWILFFILILLGIILWRKLYVSEEEKHHSTLKHA